VSIIDQIAFDQIADERDKAQQENKLLKQRIKRLEEAGDKLRNCVTWIGHPYIQFRESIVCKESAISEWDKAKGDNT
jgi:cell division septum initiation protein DivIVA